MFDAQLRKMMIPLRATVFDAQLRKMMIPRKINRAWGRFMIGSVRMHKLLCRRYELSFVLFRFVCSLKEAMLETHKILPTEPHDDRGRTWNDLSMTKNKGVYSLLLIALVDDSGKISTFFLCILHCDARSTIFCEVCCHDDGSCSTNVRKHPCHRDGNNKPLFALIDKKK